MRKSGSKAIFEGKKVEIITAQQAFPSGKITYLLDNGLYVNGEQLTDVIIKIEKSEEPKAKFKNK